MEHVPLKNSFLSDSHTSGSIRWQSHWQFFQPALLSCRSQKWMHMPLKRLRFPSSHLSNQFHRTGMKNLIRWYIPRIIFRQVTQSANHTQVRITFQLRAKPVLLIKYVLPDTESFFYPVRICPVLQDTAWYFFQAKSNQKPHLFHPLQKDYPEYAVLLFSEIQILRLSFCLNIDFRCLHRYKHKEYRLSASVRFRSRLHWWSHCGYCSAWFLKGFRLFSDNSPVKKACYDDIISESYQNNTVYFLSEAGQASVKKTLWQNLSVRFCFSESADKFCDSPPEILKNILLQKHISHLQQEHSRCYPYSSERYTVFLSAHWEADRKDTENGISSSKVPDAVSDNPDFRFQEKLSFPNPEYTACLHNMWYFRYAYLYCRAFSWLPPFLQDDDKTILPPLRLRNAVSQ